MRLSDLIHTPHLQTLSVHLSPWASEADVLLYVDFVNALLRKHKRARLYDKYALELQRQFVSMQWDFPDA